MFNMKNTGFGSVLCTLLYASQHIVSSQAAALPQPRYQNESLSSESRELVSEFHAPDHDHVALLALPERAYPRDLKWQPVMDFDTDSCYNSVAINKYGETATGMRATGVDRTYGCHGRADLDNTNVYVRRRCNRGVCAYMYAYYFPKDVGIITGHPHDWEHVVVWTFADKGTYKNEEVKYVGASAHGNWDVKHVDKIRMDGNRPKVVYFLGPYPGATHSLRFARKADDKIENYLKIWFRGNLLSWNKMAIGLLEKLQEPVFGHAHLALRYGDFTRGLIDTMPALAREREFDCAYDEPGTEYEF